MAIRSPITTSARPFSLFLYDHNYVTFYDLNSARNSLQRLIRSFTGLLTSRQTPQLIVIAKPIEFEQEIAEVTERKAFPLGLTSVFSVTSCWKFPFPAINEDTPTKTPPLKIQLTTRAWLFGHLLRPQLGHSPFFPTTTITSLFTISIRPVTSSPSIGVPVLADATWRGFACNPVRENIMIAPALHIQSSHV